MRGLGNLQIEFNAFQSKLKNICARYLLQVDGDWRTGDLFRALSPVAKASVKRLMALAVYLDQRDFERDVLSQGLFFKNIREEIQQLLPQISQTKETETFCVQLVEALLQLGEFSTNLNTFCLRAMQTLEQSKKKEQEGLRNLLVVHEKVSTEKELLEKSVVDLNITKAHLEKEQIALNQTVADLRTQLQESRSMSRVDQSFVRGKENGDKSFLNATRKGAGVFAKPLNQDKGTSDFKKLSGIINPLRVRVIEELLKFQKNMKRKEEEFLSDASENGLRLTEPSTFARAATLANTMIQQTVNHYPNGPSLDHIFAQCKAETKPLRELDQILASFKAKQEFSEKANELPGAFQTSTKSPIELEFAVVRTLYQLFNPSDKQDPLFVPDQAFANRHKERVSELAKELEAAKTKIENVK